MTPRQRLSVLLFLGWLATFASAQQKPGEWPAASTGNPTVPTVTFDLVFPGAVPSHFTVTVESGGRSSYRSDAPELAVNDLTNLADAAAAAPFSRTLQLPEAVWSRIFDLAVRADYFNGRYDYTKGRIAFTGAKTLTYADSRRRFQTVYNWSQNSNIDELTRTFLGISTTVEFGRRLEHIYRYGRLGLEDELKRMEEEAAQGGVVALEVIAPTLQKLVADRSVLHIARVRAQRLLARTRPPEDRSQTNNYR